jgi:hypothetical protein
VVPQLPQPVIAMMAKRAMRQHHYLWHTVRNNWLHFPEDVKDVFRGLGWEPPRPAVDANGNPKETNDSGEDFLFMHRQMIEEVNQKLAELKVPDYPRVEGWAKIPAPGDPDYPVPPAFDTGNPDFNDSLQTVKSDQFYNQRIKPREKRYTDPAKLKQLTLGQLGSQIEFSIHNWLHMRFCSQITEFRPDPDPHHPTAIPKKWDKPSYDWLGDFYSSHVNPLFWKLHGWVDARIDDWAKANGVHGPIPWKGTWVGKMHHQHGMHMLTGLAGPEADEPLETHLAELDQLVAAAAVLPGATPFTALELR